MCVWPMQYLEVHSQPMDSFVSFPGKSDFNPLPSRTNKALPWSGQDPNEDPRFRMTAGPFFAYHALWFYCEWGSLNAQGKYTWRKLSPDRTDGHWWTLGFTIRTADALTFFLAYLPPIGPSFCLASKCCELVYSMTLPCLFIITSVSSSDRSIYTSFSAVY